MKQIIAYRSNDGSIHDTVEGAKRADETRRRAQQGPIPLDVLVRVKGKPLSYRYLCLMGWGAQDNSSGGSDVIYQVRHSQGPATKTYIIRHETDYGPGKKDKDEWTVFQPSDRKPSEILHYMSRADTNTFPWHPIILS